MAGLGLARAKDVLQLVVARREVDATAFNDEGDRGGGTGASLNFVAACAYVCSFNRCFLVMLPVERWRAHPSRHTF